MSNHPSPSASAISTSSAEAASLPEAKVVSSHFLGSDVPHAIRTYPRGTPY